jgi:hypothetical protein
VASPAAAQTHIEVSVGGVLSGQVVKDALATPTLRARFGNDVDESARATFAPAPSVALGVLLPMRPGTQIVVRGSFSPTNLRIKETSGSRNSQSVTVVEGLFGLRHALRDVVELGAGVGAAYFRGEDRGLFRGGAPVAPFVRGDAGRGWNAGAHRIAMRAVAQLNRFDTNAITDAGGKAGNVLRYGAEVSIIWKGAVTK